LSSSGLLNAGFSLNNSGRSFVSVYYDCVGDGIMRMPLRSQLGFGITNKTCVPSIRCLGELFSQTNVLAPQSCCSNFQNHVLDY